MRTDSPKLLCPNCRSTFDWSDVDPIVCSGCATSYRVDNGIPIIRKDDAYYYQLLPKSRLQNVIRKSRSASWRVVLAEELATETEEARDSVYALFSNEGRAAFKAILPPLEGLRVLDLGCGDGVISIALARWAREVVACDLTLERLAFLAVRLREDGIRNIRGICGGDTRPLPFADAYFDCAVLNGVLEWSAVKGERSVRDGQIQFLRELRRVLTPEGHLYVGIENRYGYRYFLGAPEDHTGVKYAALAPRALADVLVKRARGERYRTYTYSYAGTRKLLRDGGFADARFFAPIPDYRAFRELHDLEAAGRQDGPKEGSWRRRLRERLERSRWLTPSFGVVASGSSVQKSWVEELVQEVGRRLQLKGRQGTPRVRVGGTSSAGLVITLAGQAVIRAPLDPTNQQRVLRNFAGLERARVLALTCPGFVAPEPLLSGTHRGASYTVESFVPGLPYTMLSEGQRQDAARRVFDLLVHLKAPNDSQNPRATAREVWQRAVTEPLRLLVASLTDPTSRAQAKTLLEHAQDGPAVQLPLAFTHGDLWWGNILLKRQQEELGLIDWDRWAEQELVTHDLLHFICHRRAFSANSDLSEALRGWLDGTRPDSLEAMGTRRFEEHFSMNDGWKLWAGLAYWVREVTGHGPVKLQLDSTWVRKAVGTVLPTLLEQMLVSKGGSR